MAHSSMAESHELWFAILLVALWAFRGFHQPFTRDSVRYSTTHGRYRLGAAVFIAGTLGRYAITLLFVHWALNNLRLLFGNAQWWQAPWWDSIDALIAALLLIVLGSRTPLDRELRRIAWTLAGFPDLAANVAASLRPDQEDVLARSALDHQLSYYSVTSAQIGELLSERVLATLCEVQSAHDRFASGRETLKLSRFFAARARALDELTHELSRLHRRAARTVIFLARSGIGRKDAYPLADLIGDEALRLLNKYKLAIAEAILSAVGENQRRALLEHFGYVAEPIAELPVWPIPTVFAIDIVCFLSFFPAIAALAAFGVISPTPHLPTPPPPSAFVGLALLHALGQTLAVAWAIYPKSVSNFSRPGIRSLPWPSYVLYGAASYACGAAISWLAYRPDAPIGFVPFVFGGSGFFLMITVVLSILTDLHLRAHRSDQRTFSVWDGIVTGLCCLSFDAMFQELLALFGEHSPGHEISALLGIEGFVLGLFLPSTAYNFLTRREMEVVIPASAAESGSILHEIAT